jgi:hypothetical protein
VCFHLNEWLRFPMDGFPKMPWFIGGIFWALRHTIGRKKLRQYLLEGMPAGKPTMPQTVGQPGEAAEAIQKLKETVARFKAFPGPVHPSPLFGAMSKDEATRLQLLHCAHHLSFLSPKG